MMVFTLFELGTVSWCFNIILFLRNCLAVEFSSSLNLICRLIVGGLGLKMS